MLGFVVLSELLSQRFIPLLVVAAGDRRCGIGAALLRKATEVCTRPKLFVSCNRSNLPAQALFERGGFEPSGRLWNLDVDDDALFFVSSWMAGAPLPRSMCPEASSFDNLATRRKTAPGHELPLVRPVRIA